MNVETIEKLVQLGVGVLCVLALIVFIYIELVNPNLALSDRAFWVLVALGGSALALKDLQALLGYAPVANSNNSTTQSPSDDDHGQE